MPEPTLARAEDRNSISAAQPTTAPERIEVIDVLRGFTIFGILLVNMPLYGWPSWGPMRAIRAQQAWGPVDDAASWFLWLFAEDKFYPLLSFLFGLGFSIQLGRMAAPAADFLSVYRRRLLALLLIGLVHGLLVWPGDILTTYALVGFLLLPFRACNQKATFAFAIIFLLLPIVVFPIQLDVHRRLFSYIVASDADYKVLFSEAVRVFSHGTFAEITLERARAFSFNLSGPISMLQILGLFLFGLYAGLRRFFQNLQSYLSFFRRARWWALGLAIVGMMVRAGVLNLPQVIGQYFNAFASEVLETAGSLALSFFYASAIILVAQRPAWKTRLAPLAAVGRTALSNYLFQSLICTTIFYSYGLGLFGRVGPAWGLALTIAIYSIQVLVSVCWLRHFRFGPMEWVWRSLTYGRLQPVRRLENFG
jgi:uncharacterized protein